MKIKIAFIAVLLAGANLYAEEIKLTDKFENDNNWTIEGGWRVEDGKLISRGKAGNYHAVLKKNTLSKNIIFESDVKVEKANTDDAWNITGIGLRRDPQNHWLLLLSESPKNLGNKHAFELGQLLGAQWGTQNKLKQIKNEVKNAKWEYGKTYHFKITLSKKIIEGVISNAEEGVLATIAYELNDTSVNEGIPFMKCAGFETLFCNVAIDVPTANTP